MVYSYGSLLLQQIRSVTSRPTHCIHEMFLVSWWERHTFSSISQYYMIHRGMFMNIAMTNATVCARWFQILSFECSRLCSALLSNTCTAPNANRCSTRFPLDGEAIPRRLREWAAAARTRRSAGKTAEVALARGATRRTGAPGRRWCRGRGTASRGSLPPSPARGGRYGNGYYGHDRKYVTVTVNGRVYCSNRFGRTRTRTRWCCMILTAKP